MAKQDSIEKHARGKFLMVKDLCIQNVGMQKMKLFRVLSLPSPLITMVIKGLSSSNMDQVS